MIAIIDYEAGNLNSVYKALELAAKKSGLKTDICITSSVKKIKEADAIVFPGVGAFGEAMKNLKKYKLVQPIRDAVNSKKPFLAVCVGLQLLFDKSYEKGTHKGLGIFKGEVKKFDLPSKYKIPHMGWNSVEVGKKDCALFKNIPKDSFFYFVHSYYVETKDRRINKIYSKYGKKFAAGICKDNVYAVQFHPEKSQTQGLKLLENFCRIVKRGKK
ncbi:imidazole glycerol phosphate synthase subunit HisH [bacterium]